MPKKKVTESQEEQTARFRAEVERLISAGELSPTEADEVFDQLLTKVSEVKAAISQR